MHDSPTDADTEPWAFGLDASQEARLSASREHLAEGARFAARLEIRGEIGRGGMGQVFLAYDAHLGREVALKLCSPSLSATQRARFLREQELASQLSHPHLVRVHSGGATREGAPFLVMERVEGARPLGALLDAPLEEVLDWLEQISTALGALHAAGIVHRDVKPANVLVDARGEAKLCDFGISWREGDQRLTQSGEITGTPTHLPPEQLRPPPRPAPSPRTDVWALGVILYRVLCGRLPYEGANLLQLLVQVQLSRPLAPSRLRPGVPPALEALCVRALAADPARRPADGAAFARALRDARAAPRGGSPGSARSSLRVALALGAGLGLTLLLAWRSAPGEPAPPPDPSPRASEPARASATPAGFAAALRERPPQERLAFAWAWLRAHPQHPERGAARAALERRMAREPLLELRPAAPVRSLLGRGSELLYAGKAGLWRAPLFGGEPRSLHGATRTCAWLPEGGLLGAAWRVLRASELAEGELRKRWVQPHSLGVAPGLLSADPRGQRVALARGRGQPALAIELPGGEERQLPCAPLAQLEFAAEGTLALLAGEGRPERLELWSLEGTPRRLRERAFASEARFAFDPARERLAVAWSGGLELYDLQLAPQRAPWPATSLAAGLGLPQALAWGPRRLVLCSGSPRRPLLRSYARTERAWRSLAEPLPARVERLALLEGGRLAALALADGRVQVWALEGP